METFIQKSSLKGRLSGPNEMSGMVTLADNTLQGRMDKVQELFGQLDQGSLALRGYSAYEIAVQEGFVGTVDEWLESLKGGEVDMKSDGRCIYWKYTTDPEDAWQVLVDYDGDHFGKVYSGTTSEWNRQSDLVGEKDYIYIYTDYYSYEKQDGTVVSLPGIKIGDGKAYLIDIPFTSQLAMDHIGNHDIHITPEERASWNEKVRVYYSELNEDTLVFTTD